MEWTPLARTAASTVATLSLALPLRDAVSQATGSHAEPVAAAPLVVMISIDGLRPEYVLYADSFGVKIPNLRRMTRQGTIAFHSAQR